MVFETTEVEVQCFTSCDEFVYFAQCWQPSMTLRSQVCNDFNCVQERHYICLIINGCESIFTLRTNMPHMINSKLLFFWQLCEWDCLYSVIDMLVALHVNTINGTIIYNWQVHSRYSLVIVELSTLHNVIFPQMGKLLCSSTHLSTYIDLDLHRKSRKSFEGKRNTEWLIVRLNIHRCESNGGGNLEYIQRFIGSLNPYSQSSSGNE